MTPAPGASVKWGRHPAAGGPWMADAACRTHEPEVFFPETRGSGYRAAVQRATAICSTCPVIAECHAHATALNAAEPLWGVWAGREWDKKRGAW